MSLTVIASSLLHLIFFFFYIFKKIILSWREKEPGILYSKVLDSAVFIVGMPRSHLKVFAKRYWEKWTFWVCVCAFYVAMSLAHSHFISGYFPLITKFNSKRMSKTDSYPYFKIILIRLCGASKNSMLLHYYYFNWILVTAMYFLSYLSMMQSEQPTLLTNYFWNRTFVKDNVILYFVRDGWECLSLCSEGS